MGIYLWWLMGFLYSLHLAFYPNVDISVLENWKHIIFWFGLGLLSQYYLLPFFIEQEQEKGER
jgi:hypothetical protein